MPNNILYRPPRAQHFDTDGTPLDSGRLIFYDAGTTNFKPIYNGITGIAIPNPSILEAGGFVIDGGIWLGEGLADVIVQKSNGAGWDTLYTIENVAGSDFYENSTNTTIDNIQDLRDSTATGLAHVLGYYNVNDNGGGLFYWDASSVAVDDGGAVIAKTGGGTGRWLRVFTNGPILPEWWGAIPNDDSLNVSSNLEAVNSYAQTNDSHIFFNSGVYELGGDVELFGTGKINVEFSSNTSFEGTGTLFIGDPNLVGIDPDVNFINESKSRIITYLQTNLENSTKTPSYPEWWGADNTGVTSGSLLFPLIDAGTKNGIIIDGLFNMDSVTFTNELIFVSGAIDTTSGSIVINEISGSPKFTGLLSGYTFNNRKEFRSSWFFDDSVINVNDLGDIYGQITTGQKAKWIWDTESIFNDSFSDPSTFDIESLFEKVLTINSSVEFGNIVSGSKQIFDPASTGLVDCNGSELDLFWFGAVSNNASNTVNTNALTFALKGLNTNQWVDLKGGNFTLDAFTLILSPFRVKNGSISGQLSCTSDFYADKVNFSFSTAGVIVVHAGSDVFNAKNCVFDGNSSCVTSDAENISIIDCEFKTTITGNYFFSSSSNNVFIQNVIADNLTSGQFSVNIDPTSSGKPSLIQNSRLANIDLHLAGAGGADVGVGTLFSGNTIKSILEIYGPNYLKAENNYFTRDWTGSKIIIYADVASEKADNLIIKNNYFDYGNLSPSDNVIKLDVAGGTWSNTGHICFIGDNDSNAGGGVYTLEGTQFRGYIDASGGVKNIAIPSNTILLPFTSGMVSSYYEAGYLSQTANWTITGGVVDGGSGTIDATNDTTATHLYDYFIINSNQIAQGVNFT